MTNKQKGQFRISQIIPFIYFIIFGSFSGTVCNLILSLSHEDSFIISIISMLVGIIPVFIFIYIHSKFKDKNIFEIIEYLFGKIIGKTINFILILFSCAYLCIFFFNLISFVSSEYLYKTPNIFILILFLIPTLILISKDLKVILRSGTIIFIFSFLLFLISISSLIFENDVTNILPMFKHFSFDGSLDFISYLVLPLFFLTCIPKNDYENNKTFNKTFIISYFTIMIFLSIFIFCIISIFGIDLALLYKYPEFQVLRKVKIGSFLSRVESALAIGIILNNFMLNVFTCYFIKTGFKYTFNIKKDFINKYVLNGIIVIVIVIFLSITMLNDIFENKFLIYIYPKTCLIVLLLLPILIIIFSLFKKK